MNSRQPPSREEILEKYRDVIPNDDFEILASEPPEPQELQKEDASLVWIGEIGEFRIWAQKSTAGVVKKIFCFVCCYGALWAGVDRINEHATIAYNSINAVVQHATENQDVPAEEYVIAVPDSHKDEFKGHDTIITSIRNNDFSELPPGTGLAPFNSSWGGGLLG